MPATQKQARQVAAVPPEKKKRSVVHHITALPQTLLEKILISDTSREDKRELRETCKLFQKILDNSLTCLRIKAVNEKYLPSLKRLLQRSNHVPTLKAVTMSGRGVKKDVLLRAIPSGITTLRIRGLNNDLKHLTGLSCLTALYLDNTASNTTGIEHISGLTYLRCHTCENHGNLLWMMNISRTSPALASKLRALMITAFCDTLVGNVDASSTLHTVKHSRLHKAAEKSVAMLQFVDSVAHLAPSLKHLNVWSIGYVDELNKLTNLETLELFSNMPTNFFETHTRVPLKHLSVFSYSNEDFMTNANAWSAAPSTLTRLRLSNADDLQPGVIPVTITHLQLAWVDEDSVQKVAAALPWLSNLDLFIYVQEFDWGKAFSSISKFQKLQCLGLWVTQDDEDEMSYTWPCQQVISALSAVPAVAAAIARGLKLNIVEAGGGLFGAEYDRVPAKATWAAHAEVVVLA